MRTTIEIEAPLLEEIRNIQRREGRSMGKVVSQLLAETLAQRQGSDPTPEFHWRTGPMAARVDLADKEAVYRELDADGS